MTLAGGWGAPTPDYVALARAGAALSFADVLDAKFDPAGPERFEALRIWAERPTPDELAQHYIRLPGAKAFYRERVPCWEADLKGNVRAMTVAAQAPDRASAERVWNEVERVYGEAVRLEQQKLIEAKSASGTRPTAIGRALSLRAASDQAWREAKHESDHDAKTGEAIFWKFWNKLCHVSADNVAFLKAALDSGNWPRISRDGEPATHDALLIVQHADDQPDFQARALAHMGKLVSKGEARANGYAALFDRVALAGGRQQRYGTQFGKGKDGCAAVRPVEDHAGLDGRRAAVGLKPLAEYAKTLSKLYHARICDDVFASMESPG